VPKSRTDIAKSIAAKLQAAVDLETGIKLTAEEAAFLFRWIRGEKYRHPRKEK